MPSTYYLQDKQLILTLTDRFIAAMVTGTGSGKVYAKI
jgi:hypothetical protein